MQKISTCLWFDNNAEEAAQLYTSCFANSRIETVVKYDKGSAAATGQPEGSVLTVFFHLDGQDIMGLNGGPIYQPSPAISLFVSCQSEAELDNLYQKLSAGGKILMPLEKYPFSEKYCWINDKYGISWQLNLAPKQQKITPAMMFTGPQSGRAEEAINFYVSQFENSEIVALNRYGAGTPEPESSLSHAVFSLHGQQFIAMDSSLNHAFTFSPSTSFMYHCDTQAELDAVWDKLSAGGQTSKCSWLTDKFQVSWQIIPSCLQELMKDPARAERVMKAVMQMTKLDIETLKRA